MNKNRDDDDDEHDPVEDVNQGEGEDEPKEEWPLGWPATVRSRILCNSGREVYTTYTTSTQPC